MKKISAVLILCMILSCNENISAQKLVSSAGLFNDGEKVCFIGNSITHSGSYHSLIYLFYLTRFPDRRIVIYNCGISGDNVSGTLNRFEKDIAVHHPTIATIKLGTNDINRGLYNILSGPNTEAKSRADATYRNKMKQLVRKLDSIGTKIIFLTPAYFEEKLLSDSTLLTGLNDGFIRYGNFLDSLRKNYRSGLVDLHYVLDSISKTRQIVNPAFTLNRADRVHPEYDGHFIMAFTFLRALPVDPFVSLTEMDKAKKKLLSSVNCMITDLKFSKNEISFSSFEKSLPFPMSAYPRDSTLVPFTRFFNQEVLKVRGLDENKNYRLIEDSSVIGIFTGRQLNNGINLALCITSPQAIQAESVAKLNEKRRQIASRIRDLKLVEYNFIKPEDLNKSKEDINEILNSRLKSMEGKSTYSYFKGQFANYTENSGKEKEFLSEIDRLVNEIYRVNKPVKHRYILTPL